MRTFTLAGFFTWFAVGYNKPVLKIIINNRDDIIKNEAALAKFADGQQFLISGLTYVKRGDFINLL